MCDDVIARVFMCACAIVSASCVTEEEVFGFRLVRSLYIYVLLSGKTLQDRVLYIRLTMT